MNSVSVLAVIAAIASLGAPLAALLGIHLTLAHQRRQGTAQDERNLRDIRNARARRALGKLLSIALQMELAADEPILTTSAQREELSKLRDQIAAAWPEMLQARADILSEPDGLKWINEFETLALGPFGNWRTAVAEHEDPRAALQALKAEVARFRDAVAAHLAELERPI
jgi:hypothetical protein